MPDFISQQFVVPARTVAHDEVASAIECVGLCRVVTDSDYYVGMEWTSRGGTRRQQNLANRNFQIVRFHRN